MESLTEEWILFVCRWHDNVWTLGHHSPNIFLLTTALYFWFLWLQLVSLLSFVAFFQCSLFFFQITNGQEKKMYTVGQVMYLSPSLTMFFLPSESIFYGSLCYLYTKCSSFSNQFSTVQYIYKLVWVTSIIYLIGLIGFYSRNETLISHQVERFI